MIDIESVNTKARIAFTDDGQLCEITNLFDADGDETAGADEAVAAVVKLPDGRWAAVDLTAFDPVATN